MYSPTGHAVQVAVPGWCVMKLMGQGTQLERKLVPAGGDGRGRGSKQVIGC